MSVQDGDWKEVSEEVQEKRRALFIAIGELMGAMDELADVDPVCDGEHDIWQWIRADGVNITWLNKSPNEVQVNVQIPFDAIVAGS